MRESHPSHKSSDRICIRGNQKIDILALNHLSIEAFVSGGDLTLVSDGVISGDAHFASNGKFSVLNTQGTPGNFVSLYDPIISSNEDVILGDYTGAALKVESRGSITAGNIRITSNDFNLSSFCLYGGSCSADAQILANQPALILRAGLTSLQESGNIGQVPFSSSGSTSSPANIYDIHYP